MVSSINREVKRHGFLGLYGHPLVIEDVQSYSEFETLKPGDTIDQVAQVDSVALKYKRNYLDDLKIKMHETNKRVDG